MVSFVFGHGHRHLCGVIWQKWVRTRPNASDCCRASAKLEQVAGSNADGRSLHCYSECKCCLNRSCSIMVSRNLRLPPSRSFD
eukprot:s7067_g3.t1